MPGTTTANDDRQAATQDTLRPFTLVLSILYFILACTHVVFSGDYAATLAPLAFVTSALLLTLYLILTHRRPTRFPVAVLPCGVAALVLISSIAHLALTRDPLHTTHLTFLLLAAAFFLPSPPTLVGLILVTLSAWLSVAWPALDTTPWRHHSLILVAACALSLALQNAHLRATRNLQHYRHQAERRAHDLRLRAAHLETLISVGNSINAFLDLDALLNHVVQTLHTTFGFDFVGIFLIDETGDYLVARAGTGEAGRKLIHGSHRLVVGELGLIGWASRHHESVCVNAVCDDERYVRLGPLDDTQSEMVIPLEAGDVLLGVLDIQSQQCDAFCDDDLRVCLSLAGQISMAIRNASRYEFEHAQRALTETLYTVGRALSQTLDISEVLDLILTSLGQIVGYDRGSVLLQRENVLEIVAARGFPQSSNPLDIRVAIKEGDVYRRIYETKEPLTVPVIEQRPDWDYVEGLPPARSWAGLPLINADDEVIGMLSLAREQPVPYTCDEVALGTAFAGQAGVALHNASLYMELSDAYRQLASLDRAKSDFISLASHELRTPLTLVMGYSHMLLEEPALHQRKTTANMIEGLALGAERLQEIVNRMVDLAEIESQTLQLDFLPMDLCELLKDVTRDLAEAAAERRIEVHLADCSACAPLEGDRMALDKVVRHLVTNAIKYTPDGGKITITARQTLSDLYGLPEPCIKIVVADTGIGIDPVHQQRIFDKFYQVGEISLHSSGTIKFRGGGPGLGLAIVKGIVEAHRGQVWVESPGHDVRSCPGSRFYVLLPLQQPSIETIRRGKRLPIDLDS